MSKLITPEIGFTPLDVSEPEVQYVRNAFAEVFQGSIPYVEELLRDRTSREAEAASEHDFMAVFRDPRVRRRVRPLTWMNIPRGVNDVRCSEYAFQLYEEEWAEELLLGKPGGLWDANTDALQFLADHGYHPTSEPQAGDIVVYGVEGKSGVRALGHFGLWLGSDVEIGLDADAHSMPVVSKFAQGPVVASEDASCVPSFWGDSIVSLKRIGGKVSREEVAQRLRYFVRGAILAA